MKNASSVSELAFFWAGLKPHADAGEERRQQHANKHYVHDEFLRFPRQRSVLLPSAVLRLL